MNYLYSLFIFSIIARVMNNISVCTIYAKRKNHLQNLVESLIDSKMQPDELIIVCMDDKIPQLPVTPFKIKSTNIQTKNDCLPLAEARNKAAKIAQSDNLIFLDVDCICSNNLVDIFHDHLSQENALYQGSARYLLANWQQHNWTLSSLFQQSVPNLLQGAELKENQKVNHPHELFWSLCFGIKRETFFSLNGFDSQYLGYGGEDTDFAFTVRSHNIPCYKISALAYHQYHFSYDPPLNHLTDIVKNARIFYAKWHMLPMKKWLFKFSEMGYVKMKNNQIDIIRYPTKAEIKACLKDC